MPTIDIQSLSTGIKAANAFAPDFISPETNVFTTNSWNRTGAKYLEPTDGNQFTLTSAASYRDVEVTFWGRRAEIYLRVNESTGRAIRLALNEDVDDLVLYVHSGITSSGWAIGSPPGDSNNLTGTGGEATSFVDLATVAGYDHDDSAGRTYTFGVSGFDFYVKMNGTEILRGKQWIQLDSGKVKIKNFSGANIGLYEITVTALTVATLFSNTTTYVLDPRDWGLKSSVTTGSITTGTNTLTVADASGFAIGDKIIVAIGHEAGAGARGTAGVGGQWPALTYASNAARNADTSKPNGTWCWVTATGLTAYFDTGDSTWKRSWSAPVDYYWSKALPKALRTTITNKVGNVLTLAVNASQTATNANVYVDNQAVFNFILKVEYGYPSIMRETVVSIPAGIYAINGNVVISALRDGWEIKGQGMASTELFWPPGVLGGTVASGQNNEIIIHDFYYHGNAGDSGYIGGSFTDADMSEVGFGDPNFVFFSGVSANQCYDAEIHNIRVRGAFAHAVSGDYSVRLHIHDCEAFNDTPWRRYLSWMIAVADSTDCIIEDCTCTATKITAGFEGFRSDGIIVRRCTSTNCISSMNSSGNFLFEDCTWTMETGCEFTYTSDYGEIVSPGLAYQNPIININSNIQPPNAAMQEGGIIRNPTVVVLGAPTPVGTTTQTGIKSYNFLCAITVGGDNPNVQILAEPPWPERACDAPLVGGYFTAPSGSTDDTTGDQGNLAVRCDEAENLIIDGIRCDGYGSRWWYGRGNVYSASVNGVVSNVVYEDHTPYSSGPPPAFQYPGINIEQFNGSPNGTTEHDNLTHLQWSIVCVGSEVSIATLAGSGSLYARAKETYQVIQQLAGQGNFSVAARQRHRAATLRFSGAGALFEPPPPEPPTPEPPIEPTAPRMPPPSRIYQGDRHIRRGAAEYFFALANLLPKGLAWPRNLDSVLMRTVKGLAAYWGFVDSRAADLLERETDPRITLEMLSDWERAFGLPDPCLAEPLTIGERQRVLVQRITMLGAQSRAFFIRVANNLGHTIRIREYAPFMCGISRCGMTWDGTVDHNPRWQIGPPENRFYWTVRVDTARLMWFRVTKGQTGIDPHLRIGISSDLECLLGRWKPAQTQIIYDYSGLSRSDPMAGTP